MQKFFYKIIFFIGWVLSPFTFWNDVIINIPIAYLCASLFVRFIPVKFLILVMIFYWLSNGLGLLLMYMSGKQIIAKGEGWVREILKLILTIVIYSIILILLDKLAILKPLR